MKTITVIVSPSGEAKVEAGGFQGQACREATKCLREALGTESAERLKPEFHQAAEVRPRLNAASGH